VRGNAERSARRPVIKMYLLPRRAHRCRLRVLVARTKHATWRVLRHSLGRSPRVLGAGADRRRRRPMMHRGERRDRPGRKRNVSISPNHLRARVVEPLCRRVPRAGRRPAEALWTIPTTLAGGQVCCVNRRDPADSVQPGALVIAYRPGRKRGACAVSALTASRALRARPRRMQSALRTVLQCACSMIVRMEAPAVCGSSRSYGRANRGRCPPRAEHRRIAGRNLG